MFDSDEIRQLLARELHNPDTLASIERGILAIPDDDDRNHVCYALVMRLTREGILDKAEDFTRLMETWPVERTWFFGDIAVKLSQIGQAEHALELLDEAVAVARRNGREWQRGEALSIIATHFLELGKKEIAISLLSEAVPIAQQGQEQGTGHDIEDSASVLRELAEKLALGGEFKQARKADRQTAPRNTEVE